MFFENYLIVIRWSLFSIAIEFQRQILGRFGYKPAGWEISRPAVWKKNIDIYLRFTFSNMWTIALSLDPVYFLIYPYVI